MNNHHKPTKKTVNSTVIKAEGKFAESEEAQLAKFLALRSEITTQKLETLAAEAKNAIQALENAIQERANCNHELGLTEDEYLKIFSLTLDMVPNPINKAA